ncbi:winged helix-turn-helix domain-containing protein [Spirillospora sp. NPDC047279]|uniref:ArsR/SmtB family transcription factor n=1 Tax=Spirillospora sp. NPDC047279 TaxID=3155478 RepID=UPI0033E0C8D0
MLRIYFTAEDVARTRIADGPDPLWELGLSMQMLRPQRGDALFGAWRREAWRAVRQGHSGQIIDLLLALNPNVGYFPDFLNPIQAAHGLEHGLETIRATGITALVHDIGKLATARRLPDGVRRLAAGEPRMLIELTTAMRTCHDVMVKPYRRSIDTAVGHDRRRRVDALTSGGVEGMLAGLRPMMRWSHGELSIPSHRDQELHLGGRGLLLIPSYFCVSGPLTMFNPSLPPVLVYPVERGADALPGLPTCPPRGLKALIGPNRTIVLQELHNGHATTTQLAYRAGISPASASEHAKILREAGLITSRRDRNRVIHDLTPLGLALLLGR